MAKYYAQISGATNVVTNFNPYVVYTGSGNYIRVEFNNDYTTNGKSGCYLFKTSSNWFSLEQGSYGQYFNIAGTTYFGGASSSNKHYWNTSGFNQTAILTLTGGSGTIVMGEETVSGTFTGNIPNSTVSFFPSSSAGNLKADFYELKVYGSGDTPVFDFVPYLSGETKGIYDNVSGQFFSASSQDKMTLVQMSDIEVSVESLSSSYQSGTSAVTITTDEGVSWSATTVPDWIMLSSTAGTQTESINVTFSKNPSYSQRTGTIVFMSSGGDTAEIECTQDKHPILVPKNNIYRGGQLVD